MLSFALFGAALANCGLPLSIDPLGACVLDEKGFPSLDADGASIPISLEISMKAATTDAFKVNHPATAGSLTDATATDSRYVLACKQVKGLKTVKMSVTRPKELTAFGGEWVQLFPKDSWKNVTNEYEPFTFNEYGAKIPVFRATTNGLTDDAEKEEVLHVFMEVSEEGDYEVMYGNPKIIGSNSGDDKWVAVQFRSTLLRVGTPWAECADATLGDAEYTVGSIMPILFGGPNLNSIALAEGEPNYLDVISELSGVTVPVKIVLEIFNKDKTSYTDSSASYGVCYKAGNACPEGHSVCKAEYCEMDVWKMLIASFKAAGNVTVLGSIDSAATEALYTGLDIDGFYILGDEVPSTYTGTGTSVLALGSPLFDENVVDDATVYVTLSTSDIGLWSPFSWYPYVPPSKWAAMVTGATSVDDVETLVDRGYGWVYITSGTGFDTKNTLSMSALLASLEAPSSRRKLEGRGLSASAPFWGCDDTLFECRPICMRKTGVVTTKVADTLCASAPMDQCACKCFHDAQWTCEGDAVVCKAKFGAGDLKTVGDKVCETRGAPKPASTAELRVASTCEPVTEMRGSAPAAQCLTQWGTPEATEAPPTSAPDKVEETKKATTSVIEESFAATLAFAALALYA